MAIRYGAGAWPDWRTTADARKPVPVAAADIAQRLGPQAPAERIAYEPLLHDSDTAQGVPAAELRQRYRPHARDRRFEDYDLVLAAAEAGLGVALLRAPLAASALASGG